MRPSPWKRRLVSAIRWTLLVDALASVSAGLLTIVPWPVWTEAMGEAWPVGMVVPEIALWLVDGRPAGLVTLQSVTITLFVTVRVTVRFANSLAKSQM